MKKISYVVRPYIHKSGRVMVRVRWNSSKIGTVFTTESSADPEKWNMYNETATATTCISTNAYGSLTHFLRYCITKVPSLCLKVANDSASLRLCVPACAYNVLTLLHF